jgi:transposase
MATTKNRGRCDRRKLRCPSDVTDDEWAHVEPMFLLAKRGGNKRYVDVREEMNGIMDILRPGCPWRAIPKDLPPRRTLLAYRDLGATTAPWIASISRLMGSAGSKADKPAPPL